MHDSNKEYLFKWHWITFFIAYLVTIQKTLISNTIIRFQVYDYDGNLTVRIDESSIGKYICRASVKGFREISASAEVLMKGNSFFYIMDRPPVYLHLIFEISSVTRFFFNFKLEKKNRFRNSIFCRVRTWFLLPV